MTPPKYLVLMMQISSSISKLGRRLKMIFSIFLVIFTLDLCFPPPCMLPLSLQYQNLQKTQTQDYRSISLIHGIYKIVTKVIVAKLKLVLPIVISKIQRVITRRQFTYFFLIVLKVIDSHRIKGRHASLLKLILKKLLTQSSGFTQITLQRSWALVLNGALGFGSVFQMHE